MSASQSGNGAMPGGIDGERGLGIINEIESNGGVAGIFDEAGGWDSGEAGGGCGSFPGSFDGGGMFGECFEGEVFSGLCSGDIDGGFHWESAIGGRVAGCGDNIFAEVWEGKNS